MWKAELVGRVFKVSRNTPDDSEIFAVSNAFASQRTFELRSVRVSGRMPSMKQRIKAESEPRPKDIQSGHAVCRTDSTGPLGPASCQEHRILGPAATWHRAQHRQCRELPARVKDTPSPNTVSGTALSFQSGTWTNGEPCKRGSSSRTWSQKRRGPSPKIFSSKKFRCFLYIMSKSSFGMRTCRHIIDAFPSCL